MKESGLIVRSYFTIITQYLIDYYIVQDDLFVVLENQLYWLNAQVENISQQAPLVNINTFIPTTE